MTSYVARFGGVAPALIAVAVGILIGRVIEAVAVGFVLFAAWSYVGRLLTSSADGAPDRGEGRW